MADLVKQGVCRYCGKSIVWSREGTRSRWLDLAEDYAPEICMSAPHGGLFHEPERLPSMSDVPAVEVWLAS